MKTASALGYSLSRVSCEKGARGAARNVGIALIRRRKTDIPQGGHPEKPYAS